MVCSVRGILWLGKVRTVVIGAVLLLLVPCSGMLGNESVKGAIGFALIRESRAFTVHRLGLERVIISSNQIRCMIDLYSCEPF